MLRNIKQIRKITFVALMACLMILSNMPLGAFEFIFKELAEATRDRKIVDTLYLSQKEKRDGNIVDNLMIPQARAAVAANSARTFYGVTNNAGRLMWATGASNSTGAEITGPVGSASNIAFMKAMHSPVRDEVMAGHIKLDGRLDIVAVSGAQDVAGDAVAQFNKTGVASTMACDTIFGSCWRPFDIAYEQLSGQAMVAFGLNATAGTLQYCSWNGSTWTPASCTTPNTFTLTGSTGALRWVRLIPRGEGLKNSRSDEILMIASDANSDIFAAIWNGSSWGNLTTITTTASTFQIQNFDGAWEETSGDAVVVWSEGTGASTQPFRYKQWTRSSTTWDGAGTVLPIMGASHIGHWVAAKTAPISGKDHIAVITNSATTMGNNCATATQCRAQPFIWNGSGFTLGNEWTSQEPVWQQIANVAVESLNSNVQAFFSSSNGGSTDVSAYQTWIEGTGFSAVTDLGGAMGDDAAGIQLAAHPNSNEVFITGEDVDADCNGNLWNGGASGTWDITGCNSAGELALAPISHTAQPSEGFAPWVAPKIYSPWSQNWRWYDDEVSATPATPLANENTTATIDQGNIVRLRFQAAELSGTAITNSRKKLQYTSCADPNASSCAWTDVDAQGGAGIWRYADGGGADDATFTSIVLTGSDANGVYVENGTAASTFGHGAAGSASDIPEWDYAIANNSVPTGTTYYFRMYDNDQLTVVFRNQVNNSATYSYPSAVSAIPSYTLTVGATGTQTPNVDSGTTTAAYLGGAFTFVLDSGSATLDSFIISEMGSTNASTSLTSVDIQTDTDGAYPGSTVTGCTGLTFNASQKLTCTPSGGLSLSSATTRYIYVVVNTISSGAVGGETIEIEITNAATEVTVTGATNGSSGTKAIGGTTTIRPYISSITYPKTSPQNGGAIGQSVTINGAGFGTSCNGASNKVEIASAIVSCTSTTFSATSISITNFQYSSGDSYGGTGASGLLVTIGNATTSARQIFYVYPSVTGVSVSEAREGDTVATISGNHFGTAEGANGVKFDDGTERTATVNGAWGGTSITNVVVPITISDSVDTVTIKIYQGTGGNNALYGTSTGFVILPKITAITNCDSSGFPSGAYGREYDAGDTPCPNTLTDGAIIINGNHFGSSGSVTILGQTATQSAVAAFCGGGAYSATCVAVRVPDTIGNGAGGAGDYVGDIVLTRSGKSDTLSGFRVLPRITGFTPGSAAISESVTVDGNHFCQNGGSCPLDFDTIDNYVIFNSNATATSFVSWNNTAMATVVPTGASTGNVFLRSNGYNSNAESFTVNVPTPANPSNLWQSRNSAFTNLIATGGVASSTPVYLSATTSSGVGGGTMYMQTEVRPTLGANKDFSSPSACSSAACTSLNPYCFENAGASYPTGGVSLTATSSITLTDEYYHWQTRARYNKSGTDYCSAWQCYPDPGCTEPSVVTDFEIDTVAPVISSASSTPSTNGATISWDTIGDLSTTQVEYGTDSGLSGSTFTAITDTPPETNGKTAGHSVALSNLNSNTTYYYRARSKDSGNLEGTSSILNFITNNVTEGPSKTTSFHIVGATGLIAGGSTATTTFAVSMPETASTTKSAFVEITGVYSSGASSKDIAAQVNSQATRTYVVPASTTSFFKFIYQVNSVNASNTLYVTPQANTTVYITSAKLIVNYAYTP